ncbi:hypothetical protein [Pseudonocardia parietis]|uniref:Uncharacterized protein n=1 Tax=Pseudonocardia parietis TaxID=570936 RepID=A0ABS4W6D4_9PSEU|nr:hypothetical protein [Pseudonocardia parietis]MBP2371774.1 hypothetical protein [Pseudonocardia parietis]
MPVQSEHHSHGHAVFPWPQLLVLLTEFALLLYGMLGFRYSGLPVPRPAGLLGVAVDPIRDVAHLVLGVAGLLCATRLSAAARSLIRRRGSPGTTPQITPRASTRCRSGRRTRSAAGPR